MAGNWDAVPNVWFDPLGWAELGESCPVAPAWRVQGTPEWEAFERERRATWRDPRVHAFLARRDAALAMFPASGAP